jgi:hypothetical protein
MYLSIGIRSWLGVSQSEFIQHLLRVGRKGKQSQKGEKAEEWFNNVTVPNGNTFVLFSVSDTYPILAFARMGILSSGLNLNLNVYRSRAGGV